MQPDADERAGEGTAVRDTERPVADLFGRVASGYDQGGFLHEIARRLVARAGVRPGDRVLDVACGTGGVLLEAARLAGPEGVMVGVDLAEPMVVEAARRLPLLGPARGGVAVMDAEQLGLRPCSFDVVCCASAVYLLGDPSAAIAGWQELLRPRGRLAVSAFGDLDPRWASKQELLGRLAPMLAPLGRGCDSPEALEGLLRSTRNRAVTVGVERLDVIYADAWAWWAEQWTHGERWALERMDQQTLAAYRVAAFTAVEACREADGVLHWRPEVVYAVAST